MIFDSINLKVRQHISWQTPVNLRYFCFAMLAIFIGDECSSVLR